MAIDLTSKSNLPSLSKGRLPGVLAAVVLQMPVIVSAGPENGDAPILSALNLSITALPQQQLRIDLSREAIGNAVLQSSSDLIHWNPEKLLPLHSTSVLLNISPSQPILYFRVEENILAPKAKHFGQSYSCNADGTICGGYVGVTLDAESLRPYPQGTWEVTITSNTGAQQNGHVIWNQVSFNWAIPGHWEDNAIWSPLISRKVQ
jgi:hypothetical protein